MRKSTLTIILLIAAITAVWAQKPDILNFRGGPQSIAPLSKQQMYEDFDQLVEIVQQYNPQIGVRKEVTGYDVIERMLQMRSNIEDIQSNADFYEFLSKVLANQIDMHSYMINYMVPKRVYHQFLSNTFFEIDTAVIPSVTREHIHHKSDLRRFSFGNYMLYHNGKYYVLGEIRLSGGAKKQILKDMILTHIDGMPVDEYVFHSFHSFLPSAVRWDFVNHKYYVKTEYAMFPKGKFSFEDLNDHKTVDVDFSKYKNFAFNAMTESMHDMYKIIFFAEEKILYIFIAQMENGMQEKIIQEAKEKCEGRMPEKIVIDVRGNPGGSDFVWMDLLQYLNGDTITVPCDIVVKSSLDIVHHYEKKHEDSTYKTVILKDTFNCSSKIDTLVCPTDAGLGYKGIYYVLQDQNTLSAAHSLSSICRHSDRFLSIGLPSGTIAGRGNGPSLFQLNHSKFTFAMECDLDITNNCVAQDYYQDIPEVFVTSSLQEEIYRLFSNKVSSKNEEYLLNKDSFFREVLAR